MKNQKITEDNKTSTDKVFYIHIRRNHNEEITRNRDPENEWDADDIYHTHSINGFSVVNKQDSWDFVLNENPMGRWYLVCVYYSTGDSFHREENCLSLVSFVENIQDAEEILKRIEEDHKLYEKSDEKRGPITVRLPITNKDEIVYTGTWKGWFEKFSSVKIEGVGEKMI